MDYFEENGCLVSDHGLDYVTYYPSNDVEIDSIVKRALMGDDISQIDYERFKTAFMIFVSQQYNDRHDYFRRILCNLIGEWVENGEFPFEEKILSEIIKGISYNNAVSYFGFDLEKI